MRIAQSFIKMAELLNPGPDPDIKIDKLFCLLPYLLCVPSQAESARAGFRHFRSL
jgi:hypothetical protein